MESNSRLEGEAMLSYSFAFGDVHVVVDRGGQVLRAEVIESGDWMDEFRRSPLARDYVREWPMSEWMTTPVPEVARGEKLPSPLHPSAAAAGLSRWFTPAFALTEKARAFDERFEARIRLLLHRGRGPLPGRRHLVEQLRQGLERTEAKKALGLIDAALHVLGVALPSDDARRSAARKWLDATGGDPSADDEPAGPGESGELRRLAGFARLLGQELPTDVAQSLSETLRGDHYIRDAYLRHVEIARWLWGPSVKPPLECDGAAPSAHAALFPPSHRGDPWPAHRLHALRALLEPAAQGVVVGPRYREELAQRFRALLGQPRDSQPKGLESSGQTPPSLAVRPLVTVEPLPELYLRLAEVYRGLREGLAERVGEAVLNELSERGTEVTLLDEIAEAEALLRGAWVVAREELGRPASGEANLAAVKAVFRRWQSASPADPDLRRDLRAVVPLEVDRERGTTRIRVFAGVETRLVRVEFEKAPEVAVHEAGGRRAGTSVRLEPVTRRVLEPVIFECDVGRIPTARELRALCDASKGAAGVREALSAR
jgi:hypothetical protein